MNVVIWILNVGIILASGGYLIKREKPELRFLMTSAFGFRLLSGVILGLVYTYYYDGGDTFAFYRDAAVVADYLTSDPGLFLRFLWADESNGILKDELLNQVPRALFMVKITTVISFITAKNYWISSLYFSFISGFAAWYFFKSLLNLGETMKIPAATAILFYPSVAFWGSGITKECVALASLFILAALIFKLVRRAKIAWWEVGISIPALYLAWNLKYYWLAIFLPVAITSILVDRLESFVPLKSRGITLLAWIVCFLLLVTLVTTLRPNFNFDKLLHVIVENHDAYLALSSGRGVITFTGVDPTWGSLIMNAPWALFSAWFRPAVTEVGTVFQGLAALENFFLLACALTASLNIKTLFSAPYKMLIFSVIAYSAMLAIFLALSTPNLGTLVRFRVGFLPFLVLIVMCGNPLVGYMQKGISRLVK